MSIGSILDRTKDFSIAVDGGAHHGTWSREMGRRFRRTYAFEICPTAYIQLVTNVAMSFLLETVTPLNVALGAEDKEVFFCGDKTPSSPVKRVYPADATERGTPSIPILMVRLDSLELPSLGFLKTDLQGYDYFALLGAEKTINRFHPVIYLEIDLPSQETFGVVGKAQELLTQWGYKELEKFSDEALWGFN